MFLEGNGFNFPQFFHLVDDQGDYRKIKSAGRRVEMKGQLSLVLEMKMKPETIQVNLDGRSRTLTHFYPSDPGFNPGFFPRLGIVKII